VIVGTQFSSYAEKIVIPETRALPAIKKYSAEENAAFAVNYMTAFASLFKTARLKPTDTILIHAAAGGVGTAAVQLATCFGCTVYGTAGNDKKLELLQKVGIKRAFNYNKGDFEKEIDEITDGKGLDVILEVVGGDVFKKSLRLLKPFGHLVVAGFASLNLQKWNPHSWWRTWNDRPRADILHMAEHSYSIGSIHLGYLLKDIHRMMLLWQELVSFTDENKIRPIIGRTFDFDEISKAHEYIESRKSSGKIVVKT